MKTNIFRRIEEATKSKSIKRYGEPSILHQVKHGKWWKLKSPWELKRLSKVKTHKDWENHQFFIKSDIISDKNWNVQDNWRCCQRYKHQMIWRTTNSSSSQIWQMMKINITRTEESLNDQMSKDIKNLAWLQTY